MRINTLIVAAIALATLGAGCSQQQTGTAGSAEETMEVGAVLLAPGNSARDTWRALNACGVRLEARPTLFAPVCDLPNGLKLRDLAWSGADVGGRPDVKVRAGSITLELGGQDARVLVPDEDAHAGARFFRGY